MQKKNIYLHYMLSNILTPHCYKTISAVINNVVMSE